jgi:hypothetical protein
MKGVYFFLGTGLVLSLVGCSSTPVALAPVGPNPFGSKSMVSEGGLQVFSSLVGHSEGNNPTWYQHTDYYIYDLHGKLVKRVDNTIGHYDAAPRLVALPAGRYLLKTQANEYVCVDVPVTIERGRTTKVHLDDQWKLPADTAKKELVSLPDGNPVGWSAESMKEIEIN